MTAVALDVVDEGGPAGFDRLTLAAVAGRAGVAVPSLYKHVASLDDLRRLVATQSLIDLTAVLSRATVGRAGPDAVRAAAAALRDFGRQHPGRYASAQVAADPSDPANAELVARAEETVAVLAGVLRGFGLPDDALIDAIRMLRSAIHGFVTLELGGGFGLPYDLDRSYDVLVEGTIAALARLTRLAPPLPLPRAAPPTIESTQT